MIVVSKNFSLWSHFYVISNRPISRRGHEGRKFIMTSLELKNKKINEKIQFNPCHQFIKPNSEVLQLDYLMKIYILSLKGFQLTLRMIIYRNEFQKELKLMLLKFFSDLNLQISIFVNLLQAIVFWRIVNLWYFIFFFVYLLLFFFIMIVIMPFFLRFFTFYGLFFYDLVLLLFILALSVLFFFLQIIILGLSFLILNFV